jgi:protein phosphatase
MQLCACGMSDVGLTRHHNEDRFDVAPERGLFLVADGMGGHCHGEVASSTAVQAIRQYVESYGDETIPPPSPGHDPEQPLHVNLLRAAIHSAHQQVLFAIRENGSLMGMGTTVAALLMGDGTVAVAHVGDSRIYRLREGELELLTRDHTWVNEQVMAGFLSEEQARVHPLKNVVTRALGGEGDFEVDLAEIAIQEGDVYLLCSDGLTTMLRDNEIAARLKEGGSPAELCRRLIRDAQGRGGYDDVTVVVVLVDGGQASGEGC